MSEPFTGAPMRETCIVVPKLVDAIVDAIWTGVRSSWSPCSVTGR